MQNLTIAAPLAASLATRGYESLTPVQEAVLVPGTEGRDMLVSAQTGSGKTVAFGLAIAPEILNGADRLLYADTPLSLIIAPTRELAQQVARELEWLYAEAGAKIATCVGGMDYRTEKRALDRGAHIVVGTPGRLRDHIERNSLDLSGVQAVELHHDVRIEHGLDLHRDLGREKELVAVDRRGELHALLADLAHLAQAPDLEAARVGEDRLAPLLEAVQAAELLHHVQARAHPQMEGVAQDDLRAHLLERARHHALDGAVGAHRHEDRRLHHAVVQGQAPAARVAFGLEQFELQHRVQAGVRASSMASP